MHVSTVCYIYRNRGLPPTAYVSIHVYSVSVYTVDGHGLTLTSRPSAAASRHDKSSVIQHKHLITSSGPTPTTCIHTLATPVRQGKTYKLTNAPSNTI